MTRHEMRIGDGLCSMGNFTGDSHCSMAAKLPCVLICTNLIAHVGVCVIWGSTFAVDAMFAALSACQALHPDADEDDDDDGDEMLDMMYTADNLPNGANGGVRGVGEGFFDDAHGIDHEYDANDVLDVASEGVDGADDSMYADAVEDGDGVEENGEGMLAGLIDQGFVTSECSTDIEMTPEGAVSCDTAGILSAPLYTEDKAHSYFGDGLC